MSFIHSKRTGGQGRFVQLGAAAVQYVQRWRNGSQPLSVGSSLQLFKGPFCYDHERCILYGIVLDRILGA